MRFFRWLVIISLLAPTIGQAQFSSVTATLTDTDGQTWNNCTWQAQLYSYGKVPTVNNVPLTQAQISQTGSCSSGGVLTGTFADSSFVAPAGSYWVLTFTPNASAQSVVIQVPIVGPSPNYSTQWSSYLGHIRFPAFFGAFGYLDQEVFPIPPFGAGYFNVTNQVPRIWTSSGWANGGGTGGSGVSSINGTPGAFTFNGAVSCTSTTCNFTGGGITGISLSGDAAGTYASGGIPVTVEGINGTLLSALSTGILKVTTGTGAISVAVPGVDYVPVDTANNSQLTWQVGSGGIGTCLVSPTNTVRTCFDSVNNAIEESDNGGAYYYPPTHIIAGTGVTVSCTLNSCTISGTGTAPGTAGQVIMSNGSGGFVVSSMTDNGTVISTAEAFLSTKVGSTSAGNYCLINSSTCIFATSNTAMQFAVNGTQTLAMTSSGIFNGLLGYYSGSSFTSTSVGWRISASNSYWTCNNTTSATTVPLCAAGVTFTPHPVTTVASATSIALTSAFANISGTTAIATITVPSGITGTTLGPCIYLIPTGLFTFTTGGNILNPTAVTPVVGNLIVACWNGSAWSVK